MQEVALLQVLAQGLVQEQGLGLVVAQQQEALQEAALAQEAL